MAATLSSARPLTAPLSLQQIMRIWWPLAAGWLLMTVEVPLLAAIIARAPEPEVNLAAWGLIFPIVLIFSAPAISLLATSTTLSKDWPSYLKLRRFAIVLTTVLTSLHAVLAFTPLYDVLVVNIIAVPAEIIEPGRQGFRIMLPFALGLGLRRFNYGVLIRGGHTSAVTLGAGVRLLVDVVALSILYLVGTFTGGFSGIVIATTTITAGVVSEAVYAYIRVRPVLKQTLRNATPVAERLTRASLSRFFVPLVMTSLLGILVQPIITAALSRMPNPLESLAVWPVVYGVLIVMGSAGLAYIEAVIVLLEEPNSQESLHRFTRRLGLVLMTILLVMNLTPLAGIWFRYVAGLPEGLIEIARQTLWLALPSPLLFVFDGWYQGALLNSRRTRSITESMFLSLLTTSAILVGGIVWGGMPGLLVCLVAIMSGALVRTAWLRIRTRPTMRAIQSRQVSGLHMANV